MEVEFQRNHDFSPDKRIPTLCLIVSKPVDPGLWEKKKQIPPMG